MGDSVSKLVSIVTWLTGVIVALAVGFGLINSTLSVPYIGVVNVWAGWIVVVLTIVGVVLAILDN
ncbi:hypothetical protein CMI41_00135 [Candidatus Pacearchaeota archaeon]|nr:hypothetical protein [Candidatus Pacearchaeota archaeon]